jgi:hypothetical protein
MGQKQTALHRAHRRAEPEFGHSPAVLMQCQSAYESKTPVWFLFSPLVLPRGMGNVVNNPVLQKLPKGQAVFPS